MLEEVRELVKLFMDNDHSGHGMNHVMRVYHMASRFAKEEGANTEIVGLAALLHDVDDYKFVGKEASLKLLNAKEIMNKVGVSDDLQEKVCDIISNMGFKKRLSGIMPTTLEGRIVSDADMCDSLGAISIIRSLEYTYSDLGNGIVFDSKILPNVHIKAEEYNYHNTTYDTDNAINHLFEKVLKLKFLMLTESGKKEAVRRHEFVKSFLREFFLEVNEQEWLDFLDKYIVELEG